MVGSDKKLLPDTVKTLYISSKTFYQTAKNCIICLKTILKNVWTLQNLHILYNKDIHNLAEQKRIGWEENRDATEDKEKCMCLQ